MNVIMKTNYRLAIASIVAILFIGCDGVKRPATAAKGPSDSRVRGAPTEQQRIPGEILVSFQQGDVHALAGCGVIRCEHITPDRFECIKKEAQRYGLRVSATTDTVTTRTGYNVTYAWDQQTQVLTFNVQSKPDNVSCAQLHGLCGVTSSNCDL